MSDDEIIEEQRDEPDPAPTPVKRGPGRPPKNRERKNVRRLGIVTEPSNAALTATAPQRVNTVELWYENPKMFLHVFSVLQNYSVSSVRMRFERDVLKMYAVDHKGHNRIYVKVYGRWMNRYYVERPGHEFELDIKTPHKIFKSIASEIGQVGFVCVRQNERSKFTINFYNEELSDYDRDELNVSAATEYDWAIEDELAQEVDYPIKFHMPFNRFKQKVNAMYTLGDVVRIEKYGTSDLEFGLTHSENRGARSSTFQDSGKIGLISTIDEHEIFSTSVEVEHIRPLISAKVAEFVRISADNERNLIFTVALDQEEEATADSKKRLRPNTQRCEIKVVTDIVRAARDGPVA